MCLCSVNCGGVGDLLELVELAWEDWSGLVWLLLFCKVEEVWAYSIRDCSRIVGGVARELSVIGGGVGLFCGKGLGGVLVQLGGFQGGGSSCVLVVLCVFWEELSAIGRYVGVLEGGEVGLVERFWNGKGCFGKICVDEGLMERSWEG